MCTLVVFHRCLPGRPLVVAANRDEFLARPAEDLAIRSTPSGAILSPLDLEAGGTWLGLSDRGVFAGLTNLRPLEKPVDEEADAQTPQNLRSRGEVAMRALEAKSALDAAEALEGLPPSSFNPFQLVIADERAAFLIVYRDRPRVLPLPPGPHVVGNVEDESVAQRVGTAEALDAGALEPPSAAYPGFEGLTGRVDLSNEPRAAKLSRIRRRVDALMSNPGYDLFERLALICREHEADPGIGSPFEATCVHIPGPETSAKPDAQDAYVDSEIYGTRSSLLLELSEVPGSSRLWTTDGPPCRHPYQNRSFFLKDLGLC